MFDLGMRYEAVIFDFHGVFTTSPLEKFATFERETGLPAGFIGGINRLNTHANAWARFERSEIDVDEFDRLFALESAAAGFEVRGKTIISLFMLELQPAMVAALRRVKTAGLLTGCITNTLPQIDASAMVVKVDQRTQVADIFALFDHVIDSSKVGVRKPESRIYTMMCDALGVEPASCIFLDDLGINLKSARALGMTTIKVPVGNVQPAIAELETLLGRGHG